MRIDSLLHFGKHLGKSQIIQQVDPRSVYLLIIPYKIRYIAQEAIELFFRKKAFEHPDHLATGPAAPCRRSPHPSGRPPARGR